MITSILAHTLPAAYAILPPAMSSPAASAMLLAIGLQESRFTQRRQLLGPAKGFWQFEAGGGVKGVLTHSATTIHAQIALTELCYPRFLHSAEVHPLLEHNDVLAACFARLLLWTLPGPLPLSGQPDAGWACYVSAWRPGKPHRATWDGFYADAWARVAGQ